MAFERLVWSFTATFPHSSTWPGRLFVFGIPTSLKPAKTVVHKIISLQIALQSDVSTVSSRDTTLKNALNLKCVAFVRASII